MTNRELINKLMELPLNAEIDFTCKCCASGTFYSGRNTPKIYATKETFPLIRIDINEGFSGEKVKLHHVSNEGLIKEIQKRMVKENE